MEDFGPPRKRSKIYPTCGCSFWEMEKLADWQNETGRQRRNRRNHYKSRCFSRFANPKVVEAKLNRLFQSEDMILYLLEMPRTREEVHAMMLSKLRAERLQILSALSFLSRKKPNLMDMPCEILVEILSNLPTFTDLYHVGNVCMKLRKTSDLVRLRVTKLRTADFGQFPIDWCLNHIDTSATALEIVSSPLADDVSSAQVEAILSAMPNLKHVTFVDNFEVDYLPLHIESVELVGYESEEYDGDKMNIIVESFVELSGRFHRADDPEMRGLPALRLECEDGRLTLYDDVTEWSENVAVAVPHVVLFKDRGSGKIISTTFFAYGPDRDSATLNDYFDPSKQSMQELVDRVLNRSFKSVQFDKFFDRFLTGGVESVVSYYGRQRRARVVGFLRKIFRDIVELTVLVDPFDDSLECDAQ